MLKNAFIVVLAMMFLGLQWRLWLSDEGVASREVFSAQVQAAKSGNEQLAIRNAELEAEVRDLKSGQAAIEAKARVELGMIKPSETFFLVVQ
tara:strand:- start:6177 stop:6452 length:276 start_codon:yes stop_codon:yes gene_type:complete